MFIHHIVTISLMVYSHQIRFHRIGSLILVLHDAADFWMEFAKIAKYVNKQFLCDISFIIFTIVWFITRLYLYPTKYVVKVFIKDNLNHENINFRILYSTTYEATSVLGPIISFDIFNLMLMLLQVMHIMWFYMILKIAYRAVALGKVSHFHLYYFPFLKLKFAFRLIKMKEAKVMMLQITKNKAKLN